MDVSSAISLVDKVLGPAIPIIHSFAWLGTDSHILKLPLLVSIYKYYLIYIFYNILNIK
jgi:hypothetical protein